MPYNLTVPKISYNSPLPDKFRAPTAPKSCADSIPTKYPPHLGHIPRHFCSPTEHPSLLEHVSLHLQNTSCNSPATKRYSTERRKGITVAGSTKLANLPHPAHLEHHSKRGSVASKMLELLCCNLCCT